MKRTADCLARVAGVAVLASVLSACVAAPPPGVVYVQTGPPDIQTEVIGVTPGPDYVWVPGYWNYGGSAYVWVGGTWQRPPHAHAIWAAPQWKHASRGWYRVDGRWH